MIFIRRVRSDSQENFFSYSNVVFDGGNGEVTGIRGSGTPDPSTPDPDPAHTGSRMAVYEIVNSWDGGFQGSIGVMNRGTSPLDGWAVQRKPGDGPRLTSVWNGAWSTASHGTVTVRNVDHNPAPSPPTERRPSGSPRPRRRATTGPSARSAA